MAARVWGRETKEKTGENVSPLAIHLHPVSSKDPPLSHSVLTLFFRGEGGITCSDPVKGWASTQ